jgi:hypothetical protein
VKYSMKINSNDSTKEELIQCLEWALDVAKGINGEDYDGADASGTILFERTDFDEAEDDPMFAKAEEDFNYWNTGGPLGPTGHGDICFSDADPGL